MAGCAPRRRQRARRPRTTGMISLRHGMRRNASTTGVRPSSPRPGVRAAMRAAIGHSGRRVRSADRRHPPAQFRRPQISRLAHVGDRTGLEMIRTLRTTAFRGIGVAGAHRAHAAQGRRRRPACWLTSAGGAVQVFKAKAIVLATGGIRRAYKVSQSSWEYTGDGRLSPIAPAPSSSTWSSSSSIPPA